MEDKSIECRILQEIADTLKISQTSIMRCMENFGYVGCHDVWIS